MLSRVDAVEGPILIAFDGSDAAQRAIADAARLLGPRRALVVTVWESGLAYAMQDVRVDGLVATPMIEPEVAMNVDREVSSQATRVAGEGAELARSLGFDAEPLAVPTSGTSRRRSSIWQASVTPPPSSWGHAG